MLEEVGQQRWAGTEKDSPTPVTDAGYVDLYDQADKIPFDRIAEFFRQSMGRADKDGDRQKFRLVCRMPCVRSALGRGSRSQWHGR